MSNRIRKWDILKFFLMFMVVLGHYVDYHTGENSIGGEIARSLYLLIYSFHMPLFIFVSGLFSKRMINERHWDKILGYLVLYFFTKVLVFAYDAIFKQEFEFRLFGETGLAWFMFALFAFALITVGASRFKPAYVLVFALVLSLLAGYDNSVNSKLVISRIIVFYPFYYAGYCTDHKKLENISRKVPMKLVAIVLVGVLIWSAFTFDGLYCVRPMFTGQHPYKSLGAGEDFGPLIRLACYAVSALACLSLVVLTPDGKRRSACATLGKFTLSVYVFHYIILKLLYNTFEIKEYFTEENMIWLLLPISLVTTILLSNKWFNTAVIKVMSIPQYAKKAEKAEEKNENYQFN